MVDIQPSDDFKNEVANTKQTELITPPVAKPLNSAPVVIPPAPGTDPDAVAAAGKQDEKNLRNWKIESALISIFALLIVVTGLFFATFAFILSKGQASTFPSVLIGAVPSLFGLLLFRRSDMARRVVIVFLLLGIGIQFLAGGFNLISTALSAVVIIFLMSSRIRKHFE